MSRYKFRFWIMLLFLLWAIYQLRPWAGWNLRLGFDIKGGARVILKPSNESVNLEDVAAVLRERLNIYGLADIRVRVASDLVGSYIVVEAPGLSKEEIEKLLASQGHFRGVIGNETVFTGGDLKVVKANVRLYYDRLNRIWKFEIPVILSPEAAKRFAKATANLVPVGYNGTYLNEKLKIYLDNELITELAIASSLRGREEVNAVITGARESYDEAKKEKDRLIAVLMAGSIPTKLEIVSIQYVTPILGEEFLQSTALAGLVAALLVATILFLRYRKLKLVAAILFFSLAEMLITLAVNSLFKADLDLSAIAGLIVSIGTGVDQEIIMCDQLLFFGGKRKKRLNLAMFVLLAAFGTIVAAMFPLLLIGLGAVRGFAIMTVLGTAVGYFITRGAFAEIVEDLI